MFNEKKWMSEYNKKYYREKHPETKKNTGSFKFNTLNKSLAYLIGVYMSDGCVSTNKKGWKMFTLEVIDKDFAKETQSAINNILETNIRTEIYQRIEPIHKEKMLYKAYMGNQELCNWLEDITGKKQYIPTIVLNSDNILQKEFIAGIIDGEGWATIQKGKNYRITIGFAVTSNWIFEIAKMLKQMKVKVTSIKRETNNRKTPLWRMNINVESFVKAGLYFKIQRKQQRVLYWKNIQLKPSETERMTSQRDEDTVPST
jgi:intein/homing endonuclease